MEERKLGLDESITKYLPRAPASWAPITVRHLLTHDIVSNRDYLDTLRDLGPPRSISLFDRRELGDDQVSRYQVVYDTRTLFTVLSVAPDGKISQFDIEM